MANAKFDDWTDVKECNDCQEYWNNVCDGTPVGVERPCKAFKATRRVDIPLEIKSLRRALNALYVALILYGVTLMICIHRIMGG